MTVSTGSSTEVFRGRGFRVKHESVTLGSGVETDYDILVFPGASAIVPLLDRETVLLLRQYRHAVGKTIWEIPAGTFNAGETPLDCAQRELPEETGYSAAQWHPLGEILPIPGHSDKRVHLFLATDLRRGGQNLDADEIVDVTPVTFDDAMAMIVSGKIMDAKSICALFKAQQVILGNSGDTILNY